MQNQIYPELAELFLALSDKTRLRLLALMAAGEVSVGYLAGQLGESQPKVSRHLAYLRGAGLVSTRRDGKWIYYGIQAESDAAVDILDAALQVMGLSTSLVSIGDAVGSPTSHAVENISDETDMTPWRPNEMEIHLL